MKLLAITLAVSACTTAPPACKPLIVYRDSPPEIVNHYVRVVVAPAVPKTSTFVDDYTAMQSQESYVIKTGDKATLAKLSTIDSAAQIALVPFEQHKRKPTAAETQTAQISLGRLSSFLQKQTVFK